jgi:hypothetical protein
MVGGKEYGGCGSSEVVGGDAVGGCDEALGKGVGMWVGVVGMLRR